MRSLILFGLFVFFLVAVQFAQAQTVDEIIDKYILARGGKDKLLSISTIYMEGSREMMGNEVAVRVTKEQGKLSRTEFDAAGATGFMLITEKDAWNYFPMRMQEPAKMPDAAVAGMQTELDIAGPLVEYAAKGHKVELIGKDSTDGIFTYKIKLTFKDGTERDYFIDTSSYLLVKSSAKMVARGRNTDASKPAPTVETITIYSDYKPIDGVLFPHNIETKSSDGQGRGAGGTTFDKIEINKPVDAKLYKAL
jgi:hypothetical protein